MLRSASPQTKFMLIRNSHALLVMRLSHWLFGDRVLARQGAISIEKTAPALSLNRPPVSRVPRSGA
jgi:hypothetical protein